MYNKFSAYLKNRYMLKVYKVPVNVATSCPNRDDSCGTGGCIFCGDEAADFEMLSSDISIEEQIKRNMEYISGKYKAEKFIIYFQNFTNTYIPFDVFKENINRACIKDVAAVYISTRPDCISDRQLDFLYEKKKETSLDFLLEIGLQTVNYRTLKILNRGHGLSEFVYAVRRIKERGLLCCAHYITDLPFDDLSDVIEGAKFLSSLGVDQVKCHSMYILKNTRLGDMYLSGEISPVEYEEFVERTISFLEYLDPGMVVQRLTGRAPEDRTLFCNWGMSWRKIVDDIENRMLAENRYQGKCFNYLDAKEIDI